MIALYTYLFLYVIWILYLAIMNLMAVRDYENADRTIRLFGLTFKIGGLPLIVYIHGLPIFFIGWVFDVLGNALIMTFIAFIELPKEWTITERVTRWKFQESGWKHRVGTFICDVWLDKFAPGRCHCKNPNKDAR